MAKTSASGDFAAQHCISEHNLDFTIYYLDENILWIIKSDHINHSLWTYVMKLSTSIIYTSFPYLWFMTGFLKHEKELYGS